MDGCAIADCSRKTHMWCTRHAIETAASEVGLQYRGKRTKTGVRRAGAHCDGQVRENRDERVNQGRKEGDAGDGKLQGPAYDCNSVYAVQ